MQITNDEASLESLAAFGTQAAGQLSARDFSALACSFGYAIAFGREPASAIREDLDSSLKELGASKLSPLITSKPTVSYFKSNCSGLFALVTHQVPADKGGSVLLELIVTAKGPDKFVTLEQVSAAAQLGVQADAVNGAA